MRSLVLLLCLSACAATQDPDREILWDAQREDDARINANRRAATAEERQHATVAHTAQLLQQIPDPNDANGAYLLTTRYLNLVRGYCENGDTATCRGVCAFRDTVRQQAERYLAAHPDDAFPMDWAPTARYCAERSENSAERRGGYIGGIIPVEPRLNITQMVRGIRLN